MATTGEVDADEIWTHVTNIDHRTIIARLQFRAEGPTRDELAASGGALDKIHLVPIMGSVEDDFFVVGLSARLCTGEYILEFQECVRFALDPPLPLSEGAVQLFGQDHALTFLMPYTEMGLRRLCADAGVKMPAFPFFVFGERVLSTESQED
ncbi:hypothetical protein HUN08_04090 [Gordonia sp. X0973]|uniref:hypothetical protein n=1 Tax=Gordonia sp. X0973 TaxID=2742602 RepID=UPI000F5236FA|nr:hypothetical protein [Gordonia sp. X0973]QKT06458.1 hypothetical protein HUN08_04090 [Gordonia sp. X0973]